VAFSIAIWEDDPQYFTLNSFDFCFGVYGKTKAYLFGKVGKATKTPNPQIHKAKGVRPKGKLKCRGWFRSLYRNVWGNSLFPE